MDDNSHPSIFSRRAFLQVALFGSLFLSDRRAISYDCSGKEDDLIDESLNALAAKQNSDGSFGKETELFGRDPAVAALVGLAFLASGSLPNRGRFGPELSRIVDFLLKRSLRVDDDKLGFIDLERSAEVATREYLLEIDLPLEKIDGLIADLRERGRKPMYGHGYATLFLAEILGATSNASLRDRTQAAVDLIVDVQNLEGGWRYAPNRAALADLSVTTCQMSALRSAQNAGLFVPSKTIENAVRYVQQLQNPDGGFRYTSEDGRSGYGRTAAALCALQMCDIDDESVERGFEYLETIYPPSNDSKNGDDTIEYWTYSQFYATIAIWRNLKKRSRQDKWRDFVRNLRRDLLERRGQDGLWNSAISTEAETAFALCAALQIREGAPVFSR